MRSLITKKIEESFLALEKLIKEKDIFERTEPHILKSSEEFKEQLMKFDRDIVFAKGVIEFWHKVLIMWDDHRRLGDFS